MNSLAAWFAINFTFRSMFSRARPAFGTSFSKAFRVSTVRLLMPPETRITKWNGADPRCGSLMISSVASASRRLRTTDAPDSSNSSIKSMRRGSEPGRERQFSVDVKSAAAGVVGCARNTEVFWRAALYLRNDRPDYLERAFAVSFPRVLSVPPLATGIDYILFNRLGVRRFAKGHAVPRRQINRETTRVSWLRM